MNHVSIESDPPGHFFAKLFLLSVSLLVAQNAVAMRCAGGLVSEGDSKITVINKCGDPSWVDRWFEQVVEFPDSDLEHRISRINERWVYNRGASEFLRILTFRDSQVLRIETGGRGFSAYQGAQQCDFNALTMASTSVEVAKKCGEPDLKDQRFETVTEAIDDVRRQITFSVEDWTYNLGPTQFIRILTFRNGELIKVITGEKGFTK